MIEYAIAAIAFAIMMQVNYIFEITKIVQDIRVLLNIEDEPNPFNPIGFSLVFFLYSTVFMPFVAVYILMCSKERVLRDISGAIMKSYFRLEEK